MLGNVSEKIFLKNNVSYHYDTKSKTVVISKELKSCDVNVIVANSHNKRLEKQINSLN